MDGKDVELRLKQNIQFLRDRSGSGQVPPEYLCQLLEEFAYFLAQAYGMANGANEAANGVLPKLQAIERRLAAPAQVVVPTPAPPAPFHGGRGGSIVGEGGA